MKREVSNDLRSDGVAPAGINPLSRKGSADLYTLGDLESFEGGGGVTLTCKLRK